MSEIQNWDVTLQTNSNDQNDDGANQAGCLVRIHPMELENKLVRLTLTETTIGRQPSCDIFCDDPSISRKHAVIMKGESGFYIRDCQSTNGTYVDSQRVSEVPLRDNDQIRVGNHIFKFLADDSIETRYHETVYNMMTKDGLTGAYNKRYLIESLEREYERAKHYQRKFSVIMMDIDFFKKLNDTYGHLAGDEVLQQFAHRLHQIAHRDQLVARFGGEEFSVILPETDLASALEIAEEIRREIARVPFHTNAGPLEVTASLGVAELDLTHHTCFSDLLESADQKLYHAKENGRNQVAG